MIPSRNFGLILLLNLGFLYLAHWYPRSYLFFAAGLIFIAAIAFTDYYLQRGEQSPAVHRYHPDIWGVNLKGSYEVELINCLPRSLRGEFAEDSTDAFSKLIPDRHFRLAAGQSTSFRVKFTAFERGGMRLGPSYFRYGSRLGLWLTTRSFDQGEVIRIYPNISDYIAFEPFLHRRRLYQQGLQVLRLHGEGTDFDSLRDYQPDDDYRKVNWKATARLSRPIVTQHSAEQNRNILMVLDAGRHMFAQISGRTRFDCYLDAAAQVSYATQLQNDRLGLLLFDSEVRFYRPPTRRTEVLADLYSFHPRHRESDFPKVYAFLRAKHARRALVFVLTELTDSISGDSAIAVLEQMKRRHQVVVVMLEAPEVHELAQAPPENEDAFYVHVAALSYLREKQKVCHQLRRAGIEVVRTFADQLNLELVNRYLSLKARQLA